MRYKNKIAELLRHADIEIDGGRPWDIQVHNPALYARVLGHGTLGLGEAYMDGWWDSEQLDEFFSKVIAARLAKRVATLRDKLFFASAHLINRQKGKRTYAVGKQHYDVGNDLYKKMLDPQMIYSCGYWRNADNLDQAQSNKLKLVFDKLKLKAGMRVLDIGCGWGGAARYAAENYGVEVVGITISAEQATLAKQNCAGLPIEIRVQDYRQLNEQFDAIYSIGMFEHVGFKNYRKYFNIAQQSLKDGGLFVLHTIGYPTTSAQVDPWIEQYIFPNSILPSAKLITSASESLFNIEDWHNFGLDYYHTIKAWSNNIEDSWGELDDYDQRFRRMWHYYLSCCAGSFLAYRNQVWQIVFSKGALETPYICAR